MTEMVVDTRWDAPILRNFNADTQRRMMSGTARVGPVDRLAPTDRKGYPLEWSRCSVCEGRKGHQRSDTRWDVCPHCAGAGSIKNLIRELAGHRCIRCGHPFEVGVSGVTVRSAEPDSLEEVAALTLFEREPVPEEAPEVTRAKPINLSPCDVQCTHRGPVYSPGGQELHLRTGWTAGDFVGANDSIVPLMAAWRILTVHHANGDKLDCRWFNLLSLCQRCHLSVQSRVVMDRVWPHEHSAWFQPYVAAFYAWRYEGREVTRAEAVGRLDELLALERQA